MKKILVFIIALLTLRFIRECWDEYGEETPPEDNLTARDLNATLRE